MCTENKPLRTTIKIWLKKEYLKQRGNTEPERETPKDTPIDVKATPAVEATDLPEQAPKDSQLPPEAPQGEKEEVAKVEGDESRDPAVPVDNRPTEDIPQPSIEVHVSCQGVCFLLRLTPR